MNKLTAFVKKHKYRVVIVIALLTYLIVRNLLELVFPKNTINIKFDEVSD